ncbi:MAG TPA: type IV pilus modification protein PilV [Terriglobales bacterium]|nr:type IV pilus modification protein PilV [Terriglobales bacterium]
MNRTPKKIVGSQRGFTLLEALVAVVVLSIGVLSLSYLVLASQKSNDDATMRAMAIELGNAILDSMRANLSDSTSGTPTYVVSSIKAYSGTANCLGTSACSASSLATSDLAAWKSLVTGSLPQGDGSIAIAKSGSYSIATVTVSWDAQRTAAANPTSGSTQLATAGCKAVSGSSCMLNVTLQSVLQ